jgi:hypothetical protein
MDILRHGNDDLNDFEPIMEDEKDDDNISISSDSEDLDDIQSTEIKQKPKSQPKIQKSKPGLIPKKLMTVGRHSKHESPEIAALKDKRSKLIKSLNDENRESATLKILELDLQLMALGEIKNIANKSAPYYIWIRDTPNLCQNILMENPSDEIRNQYQDKILRMIKNIPKLKTSNQKHLSPKEQFLREYALCFLLDRLLQSKRIHRDDAINRWENFQKQKRQQPQKRKQVRSYITAAEALRAIYNRIPNLDSENNPENLNTRIIKVIQHLAVMKAQRKK